jgi:hypothetical protein
MNAIDDVPLPWLARMVPGPEQSDARALLSAADALNRFVSNFNMAVRLFDMAAAEAQRLMVNPPYMSSRFRSLHQDRLKTYNAWMHIAARDGAIQIYHLGAVMKSFKGSLCSSPTLTTLLDIPKTRMAIRLLESYFPNYELIRNAVAHSFYEVAPNAKCRQLHMVDHPIEISGFLSSKGKGIAIADTIHGRKYIVTFEKKVASYEISDASYVKLKSVLTHFLDAFARAKTIYRQQVLLSTSTLAPSG